MDTNIQIDLPSLARELDLPLSQIQRTLELLDEGNTVPFITRYRKDQTGALDEEQIRLIQRNATRLRALAERKVTILKSIESQGKLTPDLADAIRHASSAKRLEDLYLPFKPKKQNLASQARQRGLEPLAIQILEATTPQDLEGLAQSFVAPQHGLATVADVLLGVRHLLAEEFSESADLRERLRRLLRQQARLVTSRLEPARAENARPERSRRAVTPAEPSISETDGLSSDDQDSPAPELTAPELAAPEVTAPEVAAPEVSSDVPMSPEPVAEASITTRATPDEPGASAVEATASPVEKTESSASRADQRAPERAMQGKAGQRANKKEKKRQKLESAFKDYFQFSESLGRIPPHRVLAINRGERARILRVKLDVDIEAVTAVANKATIRPDHPHREFLATCLRDALQRLVMPSLEREIRRELTEWAEDHAVEVFVRNLRNLMLQPPVQGRRVLAVDPGFRNGCKLIALDPFGNVLGHDMIHVIGRDDRRRDVRQKIARLIRQYQVSVVAIGNGTGCREAEQLVADTITEELSDLDVAYVVVNEAGASVYSTSSVGREELPDYDAVLRGAISIGRRLLDPLSELVKINPANIGVGLYQHDVKAKHLRESLDAVVESAVNYVGVDVNTASPALLRYVSGLNQLTARRVYEFRCEHGPFRTRDDLRKVPGLGDATFVQAAGFLKIHDGDNPLDATWIHPESYELARRVLDRIDADLELLHAAVAQPPRESAPPIQDTALPIQETALPIQETAPSIPETAPSIQEIAPPVQDTAPPIPETAPSVQEAAPPIQEIAPPVQDTAPPVQDTAPPIQETAPPIQEIVSPVQEIVSSASERAESALGPVVDLVDEPTAPPSGEPTAPPSGEPTAPPSGELDMLASAVPSSDGSPDVVGSPVEPIPDVSAVGSLSETRAAARNRLVEMASRVQVNELAREWETSELLLRDILAAITRPGRDPREDLPPPVFRRGIMKLEDLKTGMELIGTVLNVVDFGVFVDIGLSDSGLVHISRLADWYVRDPHEVVGVGDTIKVWVIDVDRQRRRVSLTAIPPGTERQRPEPRRRGSKTATDAENAAPSSVDQGRTPIDGHPASTSARAGQSQQGQPQGQQGQQRTGQQQSGQQQSGQQQSGQQRSGQQRSGQAQSGRPQGGQRPSGQRGSGSRSNRQGARSGEAPSGGKPRTWTSRGSAQAKPISKEMEEGIEPMRSFSDLLQFYEKKQQPDDQP